jgi:hypothetical protein
MRENVPDPDFRPIIVKTALRAGRSLTRQTLRRQIGSVTAARCHRGGCVAVLVPDL